MTISVLTEKVVMIPGDSQWNSELLQGLILSDNDSREQLCHYKTIVTLNFLTEMNSYFKILTLLVNEDTLFFEMYCVYKPWYWNMSDGTMQLYKRKGGTNFHRITLYFISKLFKMIRYKTRFSEIPYLSIHW